MIYGLTLDAVYEAAMGAPPEQDDAERCVCPDAGSPGHRQCGWCQACRRPKWGCVCGFCTQCAAPLGAESDTALTGEPICGKCAATIRAESDAPEDIGPHHGQGHPALYD